MQKQYVHEFLLIYNFHGEKVQKTQRKMQIGRFSDQLQFCIEFSITWLIFRASERWPNQAIPRDIKFSLVIEIIFLIKIRNTRINSHQYENSFPCWKTNTKMNSLINNRKSKAKINSENAKENAKWEVFGSITVLYKI